MERLQTKVIQLIGNSTYRRWVKTNVPSLHEEPFTSTIDNFYSKISFQLDYIQWNKEYRKTLIRNQPGTC